MKKSTCTYAKVHEKSLISIAALAGVPEDLLYIFAPGSMEAVRQFEVNVKQFLKWAEDREKVRRHQLECGLAFRPNQSIRELITVLKIKELKRSKGYIDNSFGEDPSAGTGHV